MNEKKQLIDTIDIANFNALANTHTSSLAKVVAVNETTIDVKPVINRVVNGRSIELTTFTKVPPLFMQGGSSYTAHPIAVGDYCLLILTERCFDRWYEGEDFRAPAELRMHDYSDGIAIVGVNPRAGAITIPSVIQQTGDTNQDGNYTHQGNRTQTGDYTITGDIDHTGDHGQTGNMTRTGTRTQTGNDTITGSGAYSGNLSAASFSGPGGGSVITTVPIESTADIGADSFTVQGNAGASGTFTTADAKTVTVLNGIITSIV